jgi:hypothetical protein
MIQFWQVIFALIQPCLMVYFYWSLICFRRRNIIETKNQNKRCSNIPFTGLGLVFGTAIGISLSLIITGNVIWGGIGTAVGLIAGAVIDGLKKRD